MRILGVDFFEPTVEKAVAGLNTAMRKLDKAVAYHEAKEKREQEAERLARLRAAEAKETRERAARVLSKLSDLLD